MERRKHFRHPVSAAATVSGETGVLPCRVANISVDGIGFSAASAVLPGSTVSIRLIHKERILFKGVVIWARLVARESEIVYEMGVKTSAMALDRITASTSKNKSQLLKHILPRLAGG